jgi:hypothetical protein
MTSSNRFAERPFSLRKIDVITGEPQLYCYVPPSLSLLVAAHARLGRFILSWWPANRPFAGERSPEPRQQIVDSVSEGNAPSSGAA